jgi:hypothetical protein
MIDPALGFYFHIRNIPNSVLKEKNNEKFEEFGKLKAKFYRNV